MSKTIEIELMAAIDAHRRAMKALGLPLGDRLEKAVEDLRALLAAPAVERQEPVAYYYRERVWATGLGDYVWREKLETERPKTEECEIKDLVPLFTSPPAPVAVALPPDPEKAFLEWASTLPSPPRCLQSYLAAIDKVKELNQ